MMHFWLCCVRSGHFVCLSISGHFVDLPISGHFVLPVSGWFVDFALSVDGLCVSLSVDSL